MPWNILIAQTKLCTWRNKMWSFIEMNGALMYTVSLWLFQNTVLVTEETTGQFIKWVSTMVKFKYLRMKVTNQNWIHEALKGKWIHGMVAIIRFIIFWLPICCLKRYRYKTLSFILTENQTQGNSRGEC